ncbi:porin [Vibrio methylphosphonaticus]|uniref:porin n=1 Tax=Vibrio methylphosphonaticus TaxID=2946866 RepID=UPI00202A5B38|nr:porin [Vibrio methylphosphonaticus]MCL9773835.1 porin [Vibrio methylphosphonaticus]
MKMAAIAAAITTTLVSGSALAAEVYNSDGTSLSIGGRAEFRGDFQGQASGSELDGTMDNKSRVRINVGGETKITDSLSGIAFYEAEQTVVNGSGVGSNSAQNAQNNAFTQRYMYAGLSTNGGDVTFGKQDAATVQISQMTDTVTTHSGIQKTFIEAGDEQINNAINYSGYFMDALSVKASLLASNAANEDGWALSGLYTLPFGLGLGLGYAANENPGNNAQDSKQFLGGLNYRWEGLYVAATYTQGEGSKKVAGNNDFNSVEFVAQYRFENNFEAVLGYQNGQIDPDGSAKFNVSDYYELTGIYYFNKSIRTYITYKFNNLKAEDKQTVTSNSTTSNPIYMDADNSLRLGLRYDF